MIEKIICAAIWFDDGKYHPNQPININTGLVFCGYGHACIFPQIGGRVSDRKQIY